MEDERWAERRMEEEGKGKGEMGGGLSVHLMNEHGH